MTRSVLQGVEGFRARQAPAAKLARSAVLRCPGGCVLAGRLFLLEVELG
jgi:hypothetical protein